MEQIDKTKVQSIIKSVEEYGRSREFEDVTVSEVNFYIGAFYELVKVIEDHLGEKL